MRGRALVFAVVIMCTGCGHQSGSGETGTPSGQTLRLDAQGIGSVSLPGPVSSVEPALTELFGRAPDQVKFYAGCAGEVGGPDYAVTLDLTWGDFKVSGSGPTKDTVTIDSWYVFGDELPAPMSVPEGTHLGEDIHDVEAEVGGTYEELYDSVEVGGTYWYAGEDETVVMVSSAPGCD